MSICLKSPADCSKVEHELFQAFVEKSGEVETGGLKARIARAKNLAFLSADKQIVGVAALKRPNTDYRKRIFTEAKSGKRPDEFPYEVGWVFVCEQFRKNGHSRRLVKKLLACAEGQKVFATSSNPYMHRTLEHLGFVKDGQAYQSSMGGGNLTLFVCEPAAK